MRLLLGINISAHPNALGNWDTSGGTFKRGQTKDLRGLFLEIIIASAFVYVTYSIGCY